MADNINGRLDIAKKTAEVFCNNCQGIRTHIIRCEHCIDWVDEEQGVSGDNAWQVVECSGCHEVSFRRLSHFSEYLDDYGRPEPLETIFPVRAAHGGTNYDNLPAALESLYLETLNAFNNRSLLLCAGGLRALVEAICQDKGVIDGPVIDITTGMTQRKHNLQGKIEGLVEKEICTRADADAIHEHRFLGNVALHEISTPTIPTLTVALNVIEHMLVRVYEVPIQADKLKQARLKNQIS